MSGLQVNMTKGSILKSLLVFSLPILMSNLFQQLYNTMDILIVGNYLGDSSLAAIGASSSIYELLIGFCFGVGSGLSIVASRYYGYGDKELVKKSVAGAAIATFISQNAGAGNKERIKKGMRIACRMSICWGIIATVVLALFAKDLVALFGSKQAEILANAALYLRVASPFYAVLGILYNMRNGLQAMGEKRKPLTSSFMELAGKILFSVCIIPVLGYWGVIICEPLIWCGMTAQLVYCYVHVMRDNLQKVGMET